MGISHVEFLVEERSMEAALRVLVPRISPGITFAVRLFNGKPDLLSKLPARLRGYRGWLAGIDGAVVVIVDRDSDDCHRLKQQLVEAATSAGMHCVSTAEPAPVGAVLNRIAVEELEAWWLGDVPALAAAYPGVPDSLASRAGYRDPDDVTGGTWEKLQGILQQAGHHTGGLAKSRAASEIAPLMDIDNNRSRSFQIFRDGLRHLTKGAPRAQA